jgi:hypothetical protein
MIINYMPSLSSSSSSSSSSLKDAGITLDLICFSVFCRSAMHPGAHHWTPPPAVQP